MANQSVSPNEAEIAKAKLKELKEEEKSTFISPKVKIFASGADISFDIEFEFPKPDPDSWLDGSWLDGVWVYDPATGRFVNVTNKH